VSLKRFLRGSTLRGSWLTEATLRMLETACRCPEIAEMLHLWVKEISDAQPGPRVALFLRESGRWIRLTPENEPGEALVIPEATLIRAAGSLTPFFVDGLRPAGARAVLVRFAGRGTWRGVVALWRKGGRMSRRHAREGEAIALAIGRTLTALRRSETSREEAEVLEKERLAAEVHDGFLPTILSAKLHAESCLRTDAENAQTLRAGLRRTHDLLGATVREVRQFLLEMRRPPDTVEEFVPWLEEYAEDFSRENGIAVDVRVEGRGELTKVQASETTRVLREALGNIRKHARARHVRIVILFGSDATTISVSDDGVGFDLPNTLERVMDSSHNGLLGMRYRIESIGGDMRLRSQPGTGTTLVFRVRHRKKSADFGRREEADSIASEPERWGSSTLAESLQLTTEEVESLTEAIRELAATDEGAG
jgi:signal transduction histidine kinase